MTLLRDPLEQRVQRILNNRSSVVIDDTFITIQEYQHFINVELADGRFRQPDHWTSPTELVDAVNDPIAGVRSEDAMSFCDWLTRTISKRGRFRLPRQNEVTLIGQREIVPWVTADEKIVLLAATQLQQQWEQEILQQIHSGFDLDLSCDFDLPLHPRVSKNTIRDAALERSRNRNRNSPLQLRLRERSVMLSRIWSVNPDSFLDAPLRLQEMLRQACKTWQSLSLFYELACDLDRAIRETDDLSLIRAYLLCVHTAWDCCCMDIETNNPNAILLTEFQQEVANSFDLYAYVTMIDQRRQGFLPCREVLQLVFEHTT